VGFLAEKERDREKPNPYEIDENPSDPDGKFLGTFAMVMMFMIPVRESLTLGVLMTTLSLI
jgi:hypothetical protein